MALGVAFAVKFIVSRASGHKSSGSELNDIHRPLESNARPPLQPITKAKSVKSREIGQKSEGSQNANIDNAEQIARQRVSVMKYLAPAMATLGLPADKFNQLIDLLVQRRLSRDDAHNIARSSGMGTAGELIAVDKAASAQVDNEIQELIEDAATYNAYQHIMTLEVVLSSDELTFGSEMQAVGEPLSGTQALSLADLLSSLRSPANYAHDIASSREYFAAGYDPSTGLGNVDRQILSQAATFLTPRQQEIIAVRLRQSTSKVVEALRLSKSAPP